MQEQNTKPNFEKDIELTNESSNSNTSYADNAELTEQEQTATVNTDIDNASVRDNSNTESNTTVNHVADKTKPNSLDTDNSLSDTSKTLEDNTVVTNTSVEDKDSYTEVNKLDANRADTAVTNNTLESNTDSQLSDKDNKTVVNTYKANTTDIDNIDTVNTLDANTDGKDTDRKLTNIEIYNKSLKPEERRENGRIGGIKSGEARRERKTFADHLKILLSIGTTQEDICIGLIEQAKKGNYKAFNSIRDTIGEMPIAEQKITAEVTTDADRQLMDKIANRLNVTEK